MNLREEDGKKNNLVKTLDERFLHRLQRSHRMRCDSNIV
jgi:hypothetical protein